MTTLLPINNLNLPPPTCHAHKPTQVFLPIRIAGSWLYGLHGHPSQWLLTLCVRDNVRFA